MKKQLYLIRIISAIGLTLATTGMAIAQCSPPASIATSAISCTSESISWAPVTGANGYDYYVMAGSTIGPSGITGNTSATLTGLSPSTVYMLYIRSYCTTGGASVYSSPYTFVTPACGSCNAPANFGGSAVACDTANLTWLSVTGATGYEYAMNTTATAPTVSGIATTATTVNKGGLLPSTTYYPYVRTNCGGTYSSWLAGPPIMTPSCGSACQAPSSITATATANTVTASWYSVTGATGYIYVIDNSSANPTVPGSMTMNTSYTFTGLMPSTTYYVHVRTMCGTNVFSPWAAAKLISTSPTVVSNVPFKNEFINVYPNPGSDKVMIETSAATSTATIELMTLDGRVVKKVMANASPTTIDIGSSPSGMYFIRYTDKGISQTIKFSKL